LTREHRYAWASRTVLVVGVVYLLATWSAVVLIDVLDIAGIRTRLASGRDMPQLWWHLFREGGPTELLQWTLLGGTALVASHNAGWFAARRGRSMVRERRFLTLLSVASVLMLIEDAGNPSHMVADSVMRFLGDEGYGVEVAARLPIFLLVGAVPLYAFVRYWPSVGFRRPGGGLLLGGFAAYGVATFSSLPANMLFDFYPRVGRFVTDQLFAGRMIPIERTADWQLRFSAEEFTGTLFMDYAYEESVELIGAMLLLAGVLAFAGHLANTTTTEADDDVSAPAEAIRPGP